MSLSPQFLDELRHRTLLSALIGRSVKLQKAGREYRACCPFHDEKTPSFYVNDDKGFYHCFGCSAHGDAIRFLTEAKGMPFMEAVKELAQAAALDLPAPDPRSAERAERATGLVAASEAAQRWFAEQLQGIAGAQARTYLSKRGVPDDLAKAFGLGFSPDSRGKLKSALTSFGNETLIEAGLLISIEEKEPYDRFRGRLMFPVRDQRGRTIAFGGRILGEGEPKYLNSPDTPLFDKGRTLYNLDRAGPASRKADRIIVVEGYMDVIALAKAGIDEVVAPLGTALTEAQIERLWRLLPMPVLCFDGDKAGRKAAIRAALRVLPMVEAGRSLRFAMLPNGLDPDDLIAEGGAPAFERVIAESISLDQLIWDSEYEAANISTPEGRADFGKRLRDHAKTIVNDDVRILYLGLFKQRHHDLFNPAARETNFGSVAGKWQKKKAVPPELTAISQFGTTKTLFAPAALKGLRRYPAVLSSHAQIIASLSVLLMHRDLRQICEEMLTAALSHYPLETDQLEAILRDAGLGPQLERAETRQRVPFSFLQAKADPAVAAQDLRKVLQILADTPEVQAAVEAATDRLKREANDEAFAEQVRLQVVREQLISELADLQHGQVNG